MMAGGPVAVLGGYGAVGAVAARQLRAWGIGPLRVGGRDGDRAARFVAERLAGAGEAVQVDLADPQRLAAFCAGCSVVLNCAGPAFLVRDRVARAALAGAADYVDAAGDDRLYDLLTGSAAGVGSGRRIVLSAGLMPGLTGLLPRHLVEGTGGRLLAYAGGRDRFTSTAAADYLASSAGYGQPHVAWRGGARVPAGPAPVTGCRPPFFPDPASTLPFLSTETERLARALALDEVRWYSVFVGAHLPAALRRVTSASGPEAAGTAAGRLCRAAELDLFGVAPYQILVFEHTTKAASEPNGAGRSATLVLRGVGASALTGVTAALAVRAVRSGEVPPGRHHAAEVLDPAAAVAALRSSDAVRALEVLPGPAGVEDLVEEVL